MSDRDLLELLTAHALGGTCHLRLRPEAFDPAEVAKLAVQSAVAAMHYLRQVGEVEDEMIARRMLGVEAWPIFGRRHNGRRLVTHWAGSASSMEAQPAGPPSRNPEWNPPPPPTPAHVLNEGEVPGETMDLARDYVLRAVGVSGQEGVRLKDLLAAEPAILRDARYAREVVQSLERDGLVTVEASRRGRGYTVTVRPAQPVNGGGER